MANLEPWQRVSLLSAFAQTMREALYSPEFYDTLASGTVRGAVDDVASAIRDDYGWDPRLDGDGRTSSILLQQYKGYKVHDKPRERQKAIPPRVLLEMYRHPKTEEDIAVSQLAIGAWFFAMRSCEYLKTPANEQKKTKLLRLRNIAFRQKGRLYEFGDALSKNATTVTITFESQKNGESFESITMHRTADKDFPLCPVRIWASIVQRVLLCPSASADSEVCTYQMDGKTALIPSLTMLLKLRSQVLVIGEEKLGFKPTEVGTHSIRSGAAMAMYLDNLPVFTIMLLGRWKSDAFLNYIRKQVEQFSHNVSVRMLNNLDWFTTPAYQPNRAPEGFSTRDPIRLPIPQSRFMGLGVSRGQHSGES